MTSYFTRFALMTEKKFLDRKNLNLTKSLSSSGRHYSFAENNYHYSMNYEKYVANCHDMAEDIILYSKGTNTSIKISGYEPGIERFCKSWWTNTLKLKPTNSELQRTYQLCFSELGLVNAIKYLEVEHKEYAKTLLLSNHHVYKANRFIREIDLLNKFKLEASEIKQPLLGFLEKNKDMMYNDPQQNNLQTHIFNFVKEHFAPVDWEDFKPYFKDYVIKAPTSDSLFVDNENPVAKIDIHSGYLRNNYPVFIAAVEVSTMAILLNQAFNQRLEKLSLASMSLETQTDPHIVFHAQSINDTPVNKKMIKTIIQDVIKHYRHNMQPSNIVTLIDVSYLNQTLSINHVVNHKKHKI